MSIELYLEYSLLQLVFISNTLSTSSSLYLVFSLSRTPLNLCLFNIYFSFYLQIRYINIS